MRLLSLPRVVGVGPEGEQITAQNGRYGPYLRMGKDSRSLASEQLIFDITEAEALAIYAQPKQRGRAAAKPPLADLGTDPVTGRPVLVKDGRFGPYVTDGQTNATLPRGEDPAAITPQRGFELLADKRAKGPTTRKRAAKAPAKRSAAKTSAAKTGTTKTGTAKTGAAKTGTTKTGAAKTTSKATAAKTGAARAGTAKATAAAKTAAKTSTSKATAAKTGAASGDTSVSQ